jgi:uncharacterized membrane protein YeaQ/YmgE (transglycosylase-associated protein family)
VTPRAQRTWRILSWCLAGFAGAAAAYSLFSFWAVQAEWLGKRDMGLALFFAFTGAWTLIACLWLAPICAVLALTAWLTRAGSAPACLIAAAASSAPFLFLP